MDTPDDLQALRPPCDPCTGDQWSGWGSNPQPSHCEGTAVRTIGATRAVGMFVSTVGIVVAVATLVNGFFAPIVASCMRWYPAQFIQTAQSLHINADGAKWRYAPNTPENATMSTPPPYPAQGRETPRHRVTIDELRSELRTIYESENTRKSAWRTDRELRRIQLLGLTWVDQITRATLSEWRSSLGPVSDLTAKGYYSALRAALAYAADSGYIDRNPALVKPMKFSARKADRKRCLNPAETLTLFRRLRAEAAEGWEQHRLYALATTIFGVGLRASEGQTLRVENVDLQRGLIDLSRQRRKTEAAASVVAMPDFVADVLAQWLPVCDSEWAFPHAYRTGPWLHGGPGKRPVDRLQQAARRAGLEGATFAFGRHGWATFAESFWGLSEKQIQIQLRHTTPLTQRHYCHSGGEAMRATVATLRFPGFDTTKEGSPDHGQETALQA